MKKRRAKQYLKAKYFDTARFNNGDNSEFEPYEKKMYDVYNRANRDASKAIDYLFEKADQRRDSLGERRR